MITVQLKTVGICTMANGHFLLPVKVIQCTLVMSVININKTDQWDAWQFCTYTLSDEIIDDIIQTRNHAIMYLCMYCLYMCMHVHVCMQECMYVCTHVCNLTVCKLCVCLYTCM